MNNKLKTMGERIKAWRTDAKLSQNALARAIDVTATAVFNWEHGVNEPNPRNQRNMCDVFGIDRQRLMFGELPGAE